jgi:hypothetical protein
VKVTSRDGTVIDVLQTGHGPSLLIVPGALTVAADYLELARALSSRSATTLPPSSPRREPGVSSATATAASSCSKPHDSSTGSPVSRCSTPASRSPARCRWSGPRNTSAACSATKLAAFATFVRATGPEGAQHTPQWLMCAILQFVIRGEDRAEKWRLLESNLRENREIARRDNTHTDDGSISVPVLVMYGGRSGAAGGR